MTLPEIQQVVRETLRQLGKLETVINKAEASRRYGRTRVEWNVKQGYLHPIRDTETGSVMLNVSELEEVMKNNNVLEKFKLKPKSK